MLTEITHSRRASKIARIHSFFSPSDILEELFYLILINSLFSRDNLKTGPGSENYGNFEGKDDGFFLLFYFLEGGYVCMVLLFSIE